ncbi:MAG TPA: IS1182 family transposase [Candidatus Deferrimicrobium sp.]|nr:IS1182 family transposase [Candidatus Deferrimicrobium sp.]
MSKSIRADFSQTYLLPPSLEDWVDFDHPARFIRDFVSSLDFAELGFKEVEATTGRPAYAVDLLLSVWLYGYVHRIRSTRELERGCREHISLLWLTGMHGPDHNTLWRFWRHNREALRGVFRQVVGVAYASGLIGLAVHAVDGTKIRSCSSKRSAWHKQELEVLLKRAEASIDAMIAEVESREETELGEYRLPEELLDVQRRRAEIRAALDQLAQIDRAHQHPQEPEARLVKGGEGIDLHYNAQVVVDQESGLIVSETVVNNEIDNTLLVAMVQRTEATLGAVAEETVADGGYYSPNELAKAEETGVEVLVPVKESTSRPGPFHKSQFSYDDQRDEYLCPLGKRLGYRQTRINSHGKYQVREYRCGSARDCPRRWQCSPQQKGRTILRGEHEAAVERQRQKQRSVTKQEILRTRPAIVEVVFAQIKEQMRFRRFTVRHLENVRTQWSLLCTVFNLRKLYRGWLAGRIAFS